MSTAEQRLSERVREILTSRLGVSVAGLDDELLTSGVLDSLGLVELLFELEAEFGVRVDLTAFDLDDARTLRRLAAWVAARTAADDVV